jgi:nitrogen-specific signal transduction histidine kinase
MVAWDSGTASMNKFVSQFNALPQDANLAHGEIYRRLAGSTPVSFEDLIHEIRQPLGVIDSLAYYLELTASNDKCCTHLQQIRAMVNKANCILERASAVEPEMALQGSFLKDS